MDGDNGYARDNLRKAHLNLERRRAEWDPDFVPGQARGRAHAAFFARPPRLRAAEGLCGREGGPRKPARCGACDDRLVAHLRRPRPA